MGLSAVGGFYVVQWSHNNKLKYRESMGFSH
jgi:hypothetical protein